MGGNNILAPVAALLARIFPPVPGPGTDHPGPGMMRIGARGSGPGSLVQSPEPRNTDRADVAGILGESLTRAL